MKISIITPTLNRARTLVDTMNSVLEQSHTDYEHIIIDGGSSDNTPSIINSIKNQYNNRLIFTSGKDNGIYDAYNKGISIASGDIIGILNSDDVFYDAMSLELIVNAFTEDEDLMCVYGDLIFVKQNDLSIIRRIWKGTQYHKGAFEEGWQPAHPTFYARRECFQLFGLYKTEFGPSSDFELMLRFIEINQCKSRYIPYTLVKMRLGGISTGSLYSVIRNNYYVHNIFKALNVKPKSFYFVRRLLPKVINIIQVAFGKCR